MLRSWRCNYQFDLIRHLVWRDFSLRYKQSALGIIWSLVLPLAQLLVLVFLFQSVVPLNIEAYPAFVFSALLPWSWFSSCLSSASGLFMNNRDLVRHPNFVPIILMVVNTLSNLLTYVVALPILVVLLFAYGRVLTPALILLPFLLLIQGSLIIGLSLVISTLNVFYRDVQHIITVALMLLFYLTPVFYKTQAVADKYQIVYQLNPLAILIQSYRTIFFEGGFPVWSSLVFASVTSLIVLGLGYRIYSQQQYDIIDAT